MNDVLKRLPGEPEVYHYPAFASQGFVTIVSGRGGGVSAPPFHSLNISDMVGDDPAAVAENRARVMAAAGLGSLYLGRQVHGDGVTVIDAQPPDDPQEADAVIVSVPGVAVGVLTADCVPILVAEPSRGLTAAVHAGRRSTERGIIAKTIALMRGRFGADPARMTAVIGPCIRACCYHVDPETARNFASCCGAPYAENLDLVGVNLRQLEASGVARAGILDSGVCVSCRNELFYSHRADRNATGRFLSAIALAGA